MSRQSSNIIAVVLAVFVFELLLVVQFGQLGNLLVLIGP